MRWDRLTCAHPEGLSRILNLEFTFQRVCIEFLFETFVKCFRYFIILLEIARGFSSGNLISE